MSQNVSMIDPAWTATLSDTFAESRANRVARNAVTSMNVMPAARDAVKMRSYHDTYNVSLKHTGKPTNQRASGRCWLFSALNVLRATTLELLDVDDFEFSQAYGMFYDKLEKANAFLAEIIALRDRPADDRELAYVLDEGMGDGGYYNFAMNLVAKWGVVPKDVMPETACSKNSAQMDRQLERLLHRDASILRTEAAAGASEGALREHAQEMLEDVWRMLAICLGEPPARFDFAAEVGSKCSVDAEHLVDVLPAEVSQNAAETPASSTDDAKPRRMIADRNITPLEFLARYVPLDPADYVDLVSIPGESRPFGQAYHLSVTDTVLGGKPLRFLNVEQSVLEQAAIASLKAGVPCSMSCDVMQDFPRGISDFGGVLALDGVDLEGLFGMELDFERAAMVDVRETGLTHAMTFQGVELDDAGEPVAWRVENSWGKDACKDGYLIMSADWFRVYGGEVVVRREFVPTEILELWDTAPVHEVAPWSGMGRALKARL